MTLTLRSSLVALVVGLTAIPLKAQAPAAAVPASRSALATARTIWIDSRTTFVKQSEMEKALLQRREFDQCGLALTREMKDADVILEVKRAAFQNSFPYSVIDRRTRVVLAAGEVNSLGGTSYGKIAEEFIKKVKAARAGRS